MHRKWNIIIKKQKALQQKIKNIKGIGEFFNDLPEEGYMRDNFSKNKVKLTECQSSTLRRYDKLLRKYYNLCQTPSERKIVNDKLQEVINELNTRPDAIIKHDED